MKAVAFREVGRSLVHNHYNVILSRGGVTSSELRRCLDALGSTKPQKAWQPPVLPIAVLVCVPEFSQRI